MKVFFRGSPGGWAQCIPLILFVKLTMFLLRKPVSSTPVILGPFLSDLGTVSPFRGHSLRELSPLKKNHQDFLGPLPAPLAFGSAFPKITIPGASRPHPPALVLTLHLNQSYSPRHLLFGSSTPPVRSVSFLVICQE